MKIFLPIAITAFIVALLSNYLQIGFKFSPKVIKPDLKKISPNIFKFFKNQVFSISGAFNLFKSLIKVLIVGAVTTITIIGKIEDIINTINNEELCFKPKNDILIEYSSDTSTASIVAPLGNQSEIYFMLKLFNIDSTNQSYIVDRELFRDYLANIDGTGNVIIDSSSNFLSESNSFSFPDINEESIVSFTTNSAQEVVEISNWLSNSVDYLKDYKISKNPNIYFSLLKDTSNTADLRLIGSYYKCYNARTFLDLPNSTSVNYKKINCSIAYVISDRNGAFGVKRAQENNIKTYVLDKYEYKERLSDEILKIIDGKVDLIVLAGFLSILKGEILKKFKNKKFGFL